MIDITLKDDYFEKVKEFSELFRNELIALWERLSLDFENIEIYDVIAALVSRQATLAIQFIRNPMNWNQHFAPMILRSMLDLQINLAWILLDPNERAKKFIFYGLGQEKLQLEKMKSITSEDGMTIQNNDYIEYMENWISGHIYPFLLEVNVGNWGDKDLRLMAQECGLDDLYKFEYGLLSAVTHNMWNHIGKVNVKICENPLHAFHRLPHIPLKVPYYGMYLIQCIRYLNLTLDSFLEFINLPEIDFKSCKWFLEYINSYNEGEINCSDIE